MSTSSIVYQMEEFQSFVDTIKNKYNLIYKSVEDIIADMKNAQTCIDQEGKYSNVDPSDLNELKSKISESVNKELDSIKDSFKKVTNTVMDGNYFKTHEAEFRAKFEENPVEFQEKNFKNIMQSKSDQNSQDPKYLELETLIENHKNGVAEEGEDLVMDNPINQIIKCPITGKEIVNECKNTLCDHVYERNAIVQYTRGRNDKKCPYAGCTKTVKIVK